MAGQILVISGPSGSGKSTLLERLLKEEDGIYFSISSTTRDIRDGEKNGVNYHYISQDEFKQGIENGDFLEWAKVHKNYYGTSLKPVKEALEQDKIVIFDIDVQGFKIVMSKFADITTSLFITTKDQKELKKRLQNRGTDSDDTIEQRIFNAVGEMEHILEYDYFFINDDLERSYKNLRSILNCMRIKSSNINLRESINNWLES
ncbi:guanylate kinase [Campylobacter sp. RM12327]|uniref:guanylate kinase n=1 Tax=Campylobacter sputorum TaxID=206 RepID=UPI000B7747AF|nr:MULTISPECIES: guanylate kinase [Campylobacter]ASM39716.1 deoxyguanylate kinase / guanylate kinase [Campylobacter sputorum]MBE7358084.1 guanylate kinase [Campylobacter sp. RM11302]MBF6668896.1 guanylate kinase [Campylobacter sp. RM12327]MBF6673810.1 guanylate kinase [Campylobacter sp. RM13538]MBF6676286.1 guanylate kinase [Campylobacter sp. RM12321]